MPDAAVEGRGRFAGQVAVVTGASRGIGLATARRLAAGGANVVLASMASEDGLKAEAAALESRHGVRCLAVAVDVAEPDQVKALFRAVFQTFRRLDILVNNAGILGDALIGMIDDATIERTLRVNLHGGLHVLQQGARLMQRGSGGAIVTVSSIIGTRGNAGQLVYAASKAGLIGATLSAAKELGPKGIRVNAVAPGVIETDMIAHLDDATRAERLQGIAMGRLGTADEVARVIAFLVSDEAAYVSGQVLGVDGAMVI
ncbi:MAG: SDR family NAD(P)-dependent oxidoreductase [Rhodospirillaceae bacterium]